VDVIEPVMEQTPESQAALSSLVSIIVKMLSDCDNLDAHAKVTDIKELSQITCALVPEITEDNKVNSGHPVKFIQH
jgi:hypothetical protein